MNWMSISSSNLIKTFHNLIDGPSAPWIQLKFRWGLDLNQQQRLMMSDSVCDREINSLSWTKDGPGCTR
jgi:hypothetical protein